jgi:hypothetical protein
MIPEFDERGYLPPGLHRAAIEEIELRFGRQSELRRVQMESLHWLLDILKGKNVRRFVINGSFTTDEYEPNDVDCIILIDDHTPLDETTLKKVRDGLPFLDIQIAARDMFDYLIETFFYTDREETPKGMIEVIL